MTVRSFHSVYMAGTVAAAALGCYLVSLRVASERSALESVESQIVDTQDDIRMLQTEIGTRGRLDQLERWNASTLALSAPQAGQFLQDSFQLATLVKPEHKLDVEAPVVLATAPAPQPKSPLEDNADEAPAAAATLVHQASLKTTIVDDPSPRVPPQEKPAKPAPVKIAVKPATPEKTIAKSAEAAVKAKPAKTTVKLAEIDPLAPLPASAKHSAHQTGKDSDRRK